MAVTAVPLEVTVAFQELVIAWLPPHVHVTLHVFVAAEPAVTVTFAVKPLPHWLAYAKVAVHVAVPDPVPTGVGEAVLTAVADGLAVRTAVADGLAVRTTVADGVGVDPESGNLIELR